MVNSLIYRIKRARWGRMEGCSSKGRGQGGKKGHVEWRERENGATVSPGVKGIHHPVANKSGTAAHLHVIANTFTRHCSSSACKDAERGVGVLRGIGAPETETRLPHHQDAEEKTTPPSLSDTYNEIT